MYALADRVRRCPSCPDYIKQLSDEQIVEMLNRYVADGIQLSDILLEVGCEVVIEEMVMMYSGEIP